MDRRQERGTSSLDVDVGGRKVHVDNSLAVTKAVEVTKVADGVPTEAKVTYKSFAEKSAAKTTSVALAGKTYTLTAGTPIGVAAATGTAADDEIQLIRKLEPRFGQADKLGKALDGKVFARGKAVTLPSAEVAGAMGGNMGEVKSAEMTMTYRGMEGANAAFDVTLKLEGDKDALHISADLAGKALIDAKTFEVASMEVSGKMAGTGKTSFAGTLTVAGHTKH